jgi:hypothetical protein
LVSSPLKGSHRVSPWLRQTFVIRKSFSKFEEATERPYGYLLMDLKPTIPDILYVCAPTYWEQASRRRKMKRRRRMWGWKKNERNTRTS